MVGRSAGTTYRTPPLRYQEQGTRHHLNNFIPELERSKVKAIARVEDKETRKQFLEDAKVLNLSLSKIKCKIKEIESAAQSESSEQTESASIKERIDNTFQRFKKAKVWNDPKRKSKVQKLLAQLKALMQDDNPK